MSERAAVGTGTRRAATLLGVLLLTGLAGVAGLAGLTAPAGAATTATPTPADEGAAAAGGVGLRLVDAPTSAEDDPRARVYIVDHLAPGTVIERRVEVSNTTTASADVSLYATAATITDGSFVGGAAESVNDLSTWTSLTPGEVTVPAGETVMSTVTIEVPDDAAPGEQYGVVWAQVSSDPGAGAVTQVSRVGIRLYVSVGPGGAPAADFTVDTLTAARDEDGNPVVLATVTNTGGRALDMRGDLELAEGPGGLRAGPFPAQLGSTLAVGDDAEVTVLLDAELPAGPWDATITMQSGLVERTATATLTFPDAGAGEAVETTSPLPGWVYPVAALVAVLLLVAVALLVRHLSRRRAVAEEPEQEPVSV